MAKFCDAQALVCGEIVPESVGEKDGNGDEGGADRKGVGRELADRVAREGEGCCVSGGKG